MTENAPTEQQQMEAVARSASAKLLAFHEGLTPDEQRALDAALRHLNMRPDGTAEDVAGYEQKIDWKPSIVECVAWQEQVRGLVTLLTLGWVTDFTPDCSLMPPPSQPA
ncbi:MAG: hypothetical protein ACRDJE_11140 [Dehalococcoidia bacterium]